MAERALISIALRAASSADRERLHTGLQALIAEDPTISATTDHAMGEVVVGGTGELHLEIIVDRLKRQFGVTARAGRPQVAYKETVTCPADGEMKYLEQTDDGRRYAHVKVRLYPGQGYIFQNEICGGAIPDEFIRAVDEGIQNARTLGVFTGYPVDDVRVVLHDGSCHGVESSALAFRIAGGMAFRDAARRAGPTLLEPIMRVEVAVPAEYAFHVMGDLSCRRGELRRPEDRNFIRVIHASVPLSDMLGYSSDLRTRTRGAGTFVMQFEGYRRVETSENDDGADGSVVGAPRKPPPAPRRPREALTQPRWIEPDE